MGIRRYDAFVSYSTDPDGAIAVAVQDGLRNLYNPWFRPGPYMRVFRDATSMAPGGGLAQKIYRGLDRSEHLVVLLSPQATDPDGYVNDEIAHWRKHPEHRKQADDDLSIIPVVTKWGDSPDGGALPSLSGFQWSAADVPASLHGVFEVDDKPLGVDMRWAHQPGADLTLANPDFYKNVAAIAAAIKGLDPDNFDKYLRARKLRARALVGTIAVGVLILLVVIGLSLGAYFKARSLAEAERQNAADSAAEAAAASLETDAARAELRTVNDDLEGKVAQLEAAAAELTAAQNELAAAQSEVEAANAEVATANARVEQAQAEVDRATAAAEAADQRLGAANAELNAARTELTAALDGLDAAQAAQAAAQQKVDALALQLDGLTADVEEAEAALIVAEQNLATTQTRLVQTQLLEEATDLAVQAAAAGADGDAALGVALALESVLTADPPSTASYRALVNARQTLADSTWQQIGAPITVGAPPSAAGLVEAQTFEGGDPICAHDTVERRPLRFIRGAALTADGRQLLVNTPSAIVSIDTATQQQRTVARSTTEICGFDLGADGSSLTMVEGTAGNAVLSVVDIATGTRRWSTEVFDMIRPMRLTVGTSGLIAIEGWRHVAPGPDPELGVQIWDPATRDPVRSWPGRLADFHDQLILYGGGDSIPAGLFDVPSVNFTIFDHALDDIDTTYWYGDGWGRATVTADPAGGAVVIVDDRGQIHREPSAVVEPWSTDIVNGLSNPFAIDHTDNRAYLGSLDGVVTVFDLTTLEVEREFTLSDVEIESLALDTVGRRLWIVDGDGATTSVALDPGRNQGLREIRVLVGNQDTLFDPKTMDATPNGTLLMIRSQPIRYTTPVYERWCDVVDSPNPNPVTAVFEVVTGEYWAVSHPALDVEHRPGVSDRYLVSFAPTECYVQLTDLSTRVSRLVEFPPETAVQAVAIAADNDRIVLATEDSLWTLDPTLANPRPVLLRAGVPGVEAIEISDDGGTIAVRDGSGVSVRSTDDGRVLRSQVGGTRSPTVTDFALGHDGTLLALRIDATLEVWDLDDGTLQTSLELPRTAGEGISLSRDGRFLSAAGGTLLWTTNGWERVAVRLPRTLLRDGVFVRNATLVTFGLKPSGDSGSRVWITDVLDLQAACDAARPFLTGRTSEIDQILRGDRTQRACLANAS